MMKLLVVSLLCLQAVCGMDLLRRIKRDSFLVGGVDYESGLYADAMAYIENGQSTCNGVCIGKRVVLTCKACVATDTPTNIKLKVGPSKTEDGGGVLSVRNIKNSEISMVITNADMTTCKPLKLPCKSSQMPAAGESTTIVSWGMTSLTTTPDKLQMLDAAWGGSETCCTTEFSGITTNGKKNICLLHNNINTHASCYGDCGAPLFKYDRVVGIVVKNSPNCATGKCSVAASTHKVLGKILGIMGGGPFMDDLFTSSDATDSAATTLPFTAPSECTLADAFLKPTNAAPGTACAAATTTKIYKELPVGTACKEKKIQKAGMSVSNNKLKCVSSTLSDLTGCPCCENGIVRYHCYKCDA